MATFRELGQTLHAACVRERLEESSVPISDIIKLNNMLTFANRPELRKTSRKDVGVQRHNMILVTQLFISLQPRPDANMADFFRFENQREPPSLWIGGHGELERRQTSFSASVLPLAV